MADNIAPAPEEPRPMESAMENIVILRVLAKNASPSDLQTYRQVNSTWNFCMTPEHYLKGTVTFKTMFRMLTYVMEVDFTPHPIFRHRNFDIRIPVTRGGQNRDQIVPANFAPFFDKYSEQIRHLKFLLPLNGNDQENLGVWLGFFQNLGHLTSLELDVDAYSTFPIDGNFNAIPVLLSLEKLKFGSYNYYTNGDHLQSFTRWADILATMAANLRSLTVKKILLYQTDYTGRFQAALMMPLSVVPPRVPNLKDFEMLAVAGTPRELLKLSTVIRKLKLIYLPTESQGIQNWLDLNNLLAKNAGTLEEITLSLKPELTRETNPPTIYIGLKLPLMPKLKAFHMQLVPQREGDSLCQIKIPFASVDYGTTTPLLEELSLDVFSYNSVTDVMLSPNLPVCQSLKKISAEKPICQWLFSEFQEKLKGRFPNAVIQSLGDDNANETHDFQI